MELHKQGFTLIELLVVVLIIGILAAIAVPQYQKAVTKAHYTQAITLVEKIVQAEQRYQLANGSYTEHFDELDIDMPAPRTSNPNDYYYSWGNCWLHDNGLHDNGYAACLVKIGSSSAVYVVFYNPKDRYCWTNTNDTRGHSFCQFITKKKTSGTSGVWSQYRFD